MVTYGVLGAHAAYSGGTKADKDCDKGRNKRMHASEQTSSDAGVHGAYLCGLHRLIYLNQRA